MAHGMTRPTTLILSGLARDPAPELIEAGGQKAGITRLVKSNCWLLQESVSSYAACGRVRPRRCRR